MSPTTDLLLNVATSYPLTRPADEGKTWVDVGLSNLLGQRRARSALREPR